MAVVPWWRVSGVCGAFCRIFFGRDVDVSVLLWHLRSLVFVNSWN